MYDWPLNVNTFTWLDRIKIAIFFLNKNNYWTQNKYVYEYEKKVAEYTGSKYAIFVSSGSSANQLIAQRIKDELVNNGQWSKGKRYVILNAVTWQTNVSVWIREGFHPIFIDVNLDDFCLDYKKIDYIIKKYLNKIACIFPTSVLGFTPQINKLKEISEKYDIKLYLDNCENFFGEFNNINICSIPSTTSCFFAHQITTGTEGGFIFTNDKDERDYFIMARAHGLTRNLKPYYNNEHVKKYNNQLVDSQFDFNVLSGNYRSSDISAFMGLLDSHKWDKHKNIRLFLYEMFFSNLNKEKYLYIPTQQNNKLNIPFCIPIVLLGKNLKQRIAKIKELFNKKKIEYRPFISGNMLRQNNYKKYGNYRLYKKAEYLNNFSIYIGLHNKINENLMNQMVDELNNI